MSTKIHVTFNVPDDIDLHDLATHLNYVLPLAYDYGIGASVDSTVWSETDFAAGLDELSRSACRVGPCWRCGYHVIEQIEVVAVDSDLSTHCPASDDGMPHEIDPPDGWDE